MADNEKKNGMLDYVLIFILAILLDFLSEIFIYYNDFAPAGLGGIGAMLQYLFGFKVGYFSLIVNIPLLIAGWSKLNREFALKSGFFVIIYSLANIVFRSMDLSAVAFVAADGGEAIMAAIGAGVALGVVFAIAYRLGGSTGGTDIVAALIRVKNPEYDITTINFIINSCIALASFFVFGRKYTPVILCIIVSYVGTWISDIILKGAKAAVKFEIFTDSPNELAAELMEKLHHACTLVNARGMYRGEGKSMLICVINRHQIVDCEKIIDKYPGSFSVISGVSSTYGSFNRAK
ncbi:MAG: YitT family protein [Firmicutes bacterium]|nr:YitT family protein [Bacillota bacterium]